MLTFLIAAHPDVGTIGERKKFYEKIVQPRGRGSAECSCGERFTACPFWRILLKKVQERTSWDVQEIPFTEFRLYGHPRLGRYARRVLEWAGMNGVVAMLPPPLRGRFGKVLRANEVLIQEALKLSDTRVFLDASKSLAHAALLQASPALDSSIIWLTRDGRGLVYSRYKRRLKTMECEPGMDEKVDLVNVLARRWRMAMESQHEEVQHWKGPVFQVKYEDVCRAPEESIRAVWNFMGVRADIPWPKFQRHEHHVMGSGSVRTTFTGNVRIDNTWREVFTEDQLAVFEREAGAFNRAMGYSSSPGE